MGFSKKEDDRIKRGYLKSKKDEEEKQNKKLKIGELNKKGINGLKGKQNSGSAMSRANSFFFKRKGGGKEEGGDEGEEDEEKLKKEAIAAARELDELEALRSKSSPAMVRGGLRSKKHAAKHKKRGKLSKIDDVIGDTDERKMEAAAAGREKFRR